MFHTTIELDDKTDYMGTLEVNDDTFTVFYKPLQFSKKTDIEIRNKGIRVKMYTFLVSLNFFEP